MDIWSFNWLFWLAGFFLVYELYAAITKGRTLSRQTWNWFSLGQRKRYWPIRRAVFVVFWVLLGIHFYFQAPALWTVILPGIPFAAVIALSSFVWKDATAAAPAAEGGVVQIKFSWAKSIGKGLQAVAEAALAAALVAGMDYLLGAVDEAHELANLGVPAVAIGVVLFVVRMLTNWWKVRRAVLAAGQLVRR